jgi:thymidine phosphorylase
MISGRGLGHTGGTLDKLDAIPGYQTQVSNQVFRDGVKEIGLAIIGQSANLAPADKRLYATRDITATVESLDLVTASILSKKLACGLDALVMDVKTGSGAVMKDLESSIELAKSISAVANGAGVKTSCLITDMSQVLATSAGNALEIAETIAFLTGEKRAGRLAEVIYALADEMLLISGLASSKEEAAKKRMAALDSGAAAQKFAQMVAFLGGPADILEQPDKYLPKAEVVKPVFMPESGYLSSMDTRAIGMAVVDLGGGRKRASDVLDYSVGLNQIAQLGQKLDSKTPVCFVHSNNEDDFKRAENRILNAVLLSDTKPDLSPMLYAF